MIYNSSYLLNKSKIQNELHSYNYRKIKILGIQKPKYIKNKNYRRLNLSNKFRYSRILSENDIFKTKLKSTNNLSSNNDTFNSFIKSDFSSSEIIIKKAREFHDNASKEIDLTKKSETAFLTENNNSQKFLKINFNSCLNDLLIKNLFNLYFNRNIYNFKERNRIERRINLINDACKHLVKNFKKNDYFDKFTKKIDKSELIYKRYKNLIDNYLSFLEVTKFKEEQLNYNLKKKKVKLIKKVRILSNQIEKYKITKHKFLVLKECLEKFKEKTEEINSEKNSNKNSGISSKTNPNLKSIENIKKSPSLKNTQNINDLKLSLSPIKKKKTINNDLNRSLVNKSPKNRRKKIYKLNNVKTESKPKSKFKKNISRSIVTFDENNILFSNPDKFIVSYEKKIQKIMDDIDHYNIIIKEINNIKDEKSRIHISSKNVKNENKLNCKLNDLKKENMILKNKLEEIKKIELNPELNLITKKAKKMVLNINFYYNLKEKFNIDFNPYFEELNHINYEEIQEEKIKNENIYLLQILEKVIEVLIKQDKMYKQNQKHINRYNMIKLENEQTKSQIRRKMNINVLIKGQLEKTKKIIERQKKLRYYPMKINGFINLNYFNSSTHISHSSKRHSIFEKNNSAKRREINDLIYYN